jgi:hypothetical protein
MMGSKSYQAFTQPSKCHEKVLLHIKDAGALFLQSFLPCTKLYFPTSPTGQDFRFSSNIIHLMFEPSLQNGSYNTRAIVGEIRSCHWCI